MKHEDIIIKEDNPFENCKLGRGAYANILSEIVDSYRTGFVLAINGAWGIGKTTFVKMWMQQLKNQGHRTIYFNAWENDFVSEPMVGILGEFKTLISSDSQKKFDSILKKAARFSNKIIPALVKGIVGKHIGEEFVDIAEKGAEATTDLFEDEIKSYEDKKLSLQTLKDELKNLVNKESGDKPLIFIVDELDRCRPDYAVEVLEKIKHFFSVEGIVFVLSIDKKQLGNSIRGYYGSENIDADEYLRRFIDIEYSLPTPAIKDFCKYLFDYFLLTDFFQNEERVLFNEFKHDEELFLRLVRILSTDKHLSLRQIEKLFAYMRITLRTFSYREYVFPDMLFLLIYLKYYEYDLYNSIKRKELKIQDFVSKIGSTFLNSLRKENEYIRQDFTYPIAKLIYCYNNCFRNTTYYKDLVKFLPNGKQELIFDSSGINSTELLSALIYCYDKYRGEQALDSYLTKIDLLEYIKHT